MTSPIPAPRVKAAGLSTGGNTVTITLTCTTVPEARQIFGELKRAAERGELAQRLDMPEVTS